MLFTGINTMDRKNQMYLALASILGIVVIVSVVFLTGDQSTKENIYVTVALPVQPWGYWMSFYAADIQGYYTEEGLNVSFIYVPEGGFGVIKQVAAGNAMFGYAGSDSLLIARSKDIPVKTIYQDTHSSSWSLIAKKEITSMKDLEGKTIAIQGPNNPLQLATIAMLKKEGVNTDKINWVPVGGQAMVSTFLGGKADAITGNELYELVLKKQKSDYNIWYAKDYGIDFVSLNPLTSENILANNPGLVEKFLRATKKGETYAIEHPEESVNAYVSKFNPSANKEIETALWKLWVDRAIQPDKYPLGQFNKEQWKMTHDTLYGLGVMDKKVDIEDAYTGEFLNRI